MIRRVRIPITNAMWKTLPSTPIGLVGAPGANFRIKPIAGTVFIDNHNGVYTGLDTTYATLVIQGQGGSWLSTPIANDGTLTPALTNVTTFFNTSHNPASSGGGGIWDVAFPTIFPAVGVPGSTPPYIGGWLEYVMTTAKIDEDNKGIELALDNNGNTADLGGGHASNYGYAIVYFVKEPTEQ